MALSIHKKLKIKAPVGWVWNALTDKSEIENWWSEYVELQPKKGGLFKESWLDDKGNKQLATGKVLSVKKLDHITFTWVEKTWPKTAQTVCHLQFTTQDNFCTLELTHEGWESLPKELQKPTMKDFEVGWKYHFEELKSYLED